MQITEKQGCDALPDVVTWLSFKCEPNKYSIGSGIQEIKNGLDNFNKTVLDEIAHFDVLSLRAPRRGSIYNPPRVAKFGDAFASR